MPNNYILSEDPRFDVVNLRPVKPGDEYYLLNKQTGTVTKIGPQEIKTIFAHSIDDIKKIIDDVIRKNIALDYSEYVQYLVDKRTNYVLDSIIASKSLMRYKGCCDQLPEEANIGEVYCRGDKYFVRTSNLYWKQILTYDNLHDILLNYYTREELNAKIDELRDEIAALSGYIQSRADELDISLSSYITKEEALAKLATYERNVGIYRETYEQQITRLQNSWNNETAAILAWRQAEQLKIDKTNSSYLDIKTRHEAQVDMISSFIDEKTLEINACNRQISGMLHEFRSLESLTSALLQDLSTYEDRFNAMKSQIDLLTAKLDELQQFDQSILDI